MKILVDLGMTISSTVGQIVMTPPNCGRIYNSEGALPTVNWHLQPASAKINSMATVTTDLQHPLKGVQGGDQN